MARTPSEATASKHEQIRVEYRAMYNDSGMRPSVIYKKLAKKYYLSKERIRDICTGSKK